MIKLFQVLMIFSILQKRTISSNNFPSVEDTMEVLMLSALAPELESCDLFALPPDFPPDLSCEYVEEKEKNGTKVAVIVSEMKQYVAVVYVGTDSKADALSDADLRFVRFGPERYPLVSNRKVKVHSGFNTEVFGGGFYDRLLIFVSNSMINKYPTYRLLVTGHSLGGANSILTSVAFAISFASSGIHVLVENISTGSPRTGTNAFRIFANNLTNLSMWRLVLKEDIVPRLPPNMISWKHPGHTIQMNENGTLCYYQHYGDKALGYAGVPLSWNYVSYAKPISGCIFHFLVSYLDYVKGMTFSNNSNLIVSSFVPI
jgi:hypothetical protein